MQNVSVRAQWATAIAIVLLVGLFALMASAQMAFAADNLVGATSSLGITTEADSTENEADEGSGDAAADATNPSTKKLLSKASVTARAKVKGTGWLHTVEAGKTVGTKSKKALCALKVSLVNTEGVKGSICYRLYSSKSGWTETAKNGAVAKTGKRNASAVRIWLKGTVAEYFDVYYQGYIKGYGWLDWASNKQIAGATDLDISLSAVRVKLVKKNKTFKGLTTMRWLKSRWDVLEFKYRNDESVNQLLEVKYTGGVKAKIVLKQKADNDWETFLTCSGYVGKSGIGQAREGISRTPVGDFEITEAFGIKGNPGTCLRYVKVNSNMYWCADSSYYNTLIDITKKPHYCTGEHLIDYSPYYDYGLFFDYNTNPIKYGKGSAFFVHCTGPSSPSGTGGCVAMSKTNMVKVIQYLEPCARLLIYKK